MLQKCLLTKWWKIWKWLVSVIRIYKVKVAERLCTKQDNTTAVPQHRFASCRVSVGTENVLLNFLECMTSRIISYNLLFLLYLYFWLTITCPIRFPLSCFAIIISVKYLYIYFKCHLSFFIFSSWIHFINKTTLYFCCFFLATCSFIYYMMLTCKILNHEHQQLSFNLYLKIYLSDTHNHPPFWTLSHIYFPPLNLLWASSLSSYVPIIRLEAPRLHSG